jgi:hypothetical protein
MPAMPAMPLGVFDAVDRAATASRAGQLTVNDLPVRDWVPHRAML